MRFIVGIGNVGRPYEKTRHNVGFEALDAIASRKQLDRASLVKPDAYVNATGSTVAEIVHKRQTKLSDVLVVCDDVNLRFGKLRLRASGSAGGHHGLQSIIDEMKSEDFPRLRIGVGNERMPKDDLVPFVLAKFEPEEQKQLDKILENVALVCECWSREGFNAALDKLSQCQSVQSQEKS